MADVAVAQMHIDVDEDSGTFTATYAEQPSMGVGSPPF